MMWSVSVQPILLCACLAVGLLFDPMGFLRMALLCSVVHELGHVVAYWGATGRFPPLQLSVGGITLKKIHFLSLRQEIVVLLAGPAANFIFVAVLYGVALHKASYGVCFLAAVSFCTGVYNLLPIGVLDGARLLQNLFPAHYQTRILCAERFMAVLLSAAIVPLLAIAPLTPTTRAAVILAAGYLWIQQMWT